MVLILVLQLFPSGLILRSDKPGASQILHQFDTAERNEQDTYRWSLPDATLVLDSFWARPLLLTLRITSPRPTSAPPAHMQVIRGDWHSDTFAIQNGWRRYHLLVPANMQTHITFNIPTFTPSANDNDNDNDTRCLGFALSDLAVSRPATTGWRFPPPLHLALVLPLPLLFVVVSGSLWPGVQRIRILALLIAHLILATTIIATLSPRTWGFLVPTLWLLWLLLVAKHIAPIVASRYLHHTLYRSTHVATLSLIPLALYLAIIVFLPFPAGMQPTNGDEPHYLLLAHSLVYDHDADLRNNYLQRDYLPFYSSPDIDWHTITHLREGRISSHIMIGLPILIAPAYLLAGRVGVLLLLSVLVWLATVVLAQLLQRYHTAQLAMWGVLFCAISYPLVIYSQQIFPETVAFVLVTYVLYHTLRPTRRAPTPQPIAHQEHGTTERDSLSPTHPRLHALTVGYALAFLPHVHYKLIPTAGMLYLFFLWKHRRYWQSILSWSLPPLLLSSILFLAWIYVLFGTLSPQVFVAPIGGTFLESETLKAGIPGLLFDQEYGLFFYAPFYVLALPGAWWFCTNRSTRSDGLFLLLIYLVHHSLSAAYEMWYGSFSPVPRYLIPVLPILIIWSIRACAEYWQRGVWLRLLLLIALQSGITLIILANRVHMFGFELGSNSLLREVFHAPHVIAWLPTFTQGNLPTAYARMAVLIVILLLCLIPRLHRSASR